MKGGPAYIIMTILLLSSRAGSVEKPKDEESNNSQSQTTPPAENKEPSPSTSDEKKPPAENKDTSTSPNEEKKQPEKTKESPPSPSKEKNQPEKTKETPPSPSKENKTPPKDKKENPDKEQDSGQEETRKRSSPPAKEDEKTKKESVKKVPESKQKEKEKHSSEKDDSKSSQSQGAVVGISSPVAAQVEDNWLLSIMKMVDKKGMVTKLVTKVAFKNLPEDLSGKSEEDIMGYVDILAEERENIQERLLFGMGLKMFVGFVSYEYYNHGLLLSPLKYLADNDVNLSTSIGEQWVEHQERLASFVCKLMKVRKIDINSLPKSQMGIPLIKLKRAKDAVVSFPVWRSEDGSELPLEAKLITGDSKAMLLNFWVN